MTSEGRLALSTPTNRRELCKTRIRPLEAQWREAMLRDDMVEAKRLMFLITDEVQDYMQARGAYAPTHRVGNVTEGSNGQ
jgi:hypothetical protein